MSQSQTGTQISTTLIPYVNTLSVTTTDSNSLINLSKSNNTLSFNYDNLISRLSTYQTTTSYNSSIANYFTKTEITNTLGSYVKAVTNTTNDNLSLISLTKNNNVLALNYNNLASKFGGYYSTAEIDLKLGQKVDNFTIGVGLNFLSSGGSTELIFDPVILGSPTSGGLSVYDKLNFGFNQLKGSSNIILSLTNNIIHFNLNNVYTSSEADSLFATTTFLNTTIANLI